MSDAVDMSGAGERPRFRWRRLNTRWVIVPGAIAATVLAWLAYVGAHAHGVVEGRVVDSAGKPVAGATVLLFKRGFVTHEEAGRATTDAAGAFRFTDNASHSIQLEADSPALGRSERRVVRLMFAGQDTRVDDPLRFTKPQ